MAAQREVDALAYCLELVRTLRRDMRRDMEAITAACRANPEVAPFVREQLGQMVEKMDEGVERCKAGLARIDRIDRPVRVESSRARALRSRRPSPRPGRYARARTPRLTRRATASAASRDGPSRSDDDDPHDDVVLAREGAA